MSYVVSQNNTAMFTQVPEIIFDSSLEKKIASPENETCP